MSHPYTEDALEVSTMELLEFLGWEDAAKRLEEGLEKTIGEGVVTQDLARLMPDTEPVGTSEFAQAVVRVIEGR